MLQVHLSARLCHRQLCSTCWGYWHSPLHSLSFYQGHLTVHSQRSQASSQQNRQHSSRAYPGCWLSLIRRYKRYELQYVITGLYSFQNQRETQLKKASVSAECSLVLWLKSWQPSVSGKTPLALWQSAAACWADQLRDGLQQTHEQRGCLAQMKYREFSGKAANILWSPSHDVYLFKDGGVWGGEGGVLWKSRKGGRMREDNLGKHE